MKDVKETIEQHEEVNIRTGVKAGDGPVIGSGGGTGQTGSGGRTGQLGSGG
jgi:hypothetical protein